MGETRLTDINEHLRHILLECGRKKQLTGDGLDLWVFNVASKLHLCGITKPDHILEWGWYINSDLKNNGHTILYSTTIAMLTRLSIEHCPVAPPPMDTFLRQTLTYLPLQQRNKGLWVQQVINKLTKVKVQTPWELISRVHRINDDLRNEFLSRFNDLTLRAFTRAAFYFLE